jgi:hypothetical protein
MVSTVMNFAPFVDMTELNRSLMVLISAVFAATMPG